jgi:hypothetical protein
MKVATNQRQRVLFLWLARLALFAYAFQLTAVDHWHKDINTVEGVQGSSEHRYHCHADPSGCAEQPALSGSLAEVKLAPIPPSGAFQTAVIASLPAPSAAFIASADDPPRYS